MIRVYSGFHGRTIIFCETKKEAQELSQNVSIRQVGPCPPFPIGREPLPTDRPRFPVRASLICQSPLTDEGRVTQTQGYPDAVGLITLVW